MGQLKETVVAGIKSARAATDPTDLVRLLELDAALAQHPTTAEMTSAIEDAQAVITKLDTASVKITLTGNQISAVVSAGDGLTIGSSLQIDWGTGHIQVPYGDHVHDNDHAVATGSETDTAVSSLSGASGQEIQVSVKIQGAYLYSDENGIGFDDSEVVGSSHSHNPATISANGFMSTAHVVSLNTLIAHDEATAFNDSSTISWDGTRGAARLLYSTGLKVGAEGVEVDFDDVAHKVHSHSEYITGQPVNGSYRIMPDNIYIYDSGADPGTPWRALGCNNGQLIFGPPVALA